MDGSPEGKEIKVKKKLLALGMTSVILLSACGNTAPTGETPEQKAVLCESASSALSQTTTEYKARYYADVVINNC